MSAVDRGPHGHERGFLTPAEAAAIVRVAPRTLARWAAQGHLSFVRTPGGHRRYAEGDVISLVRGVPGAGRATPGSLGDLPRLTLNGVARAPIRSTDSND